MKENNAAVETGDDESGMNNVAARVAISVIYVFGDCWDGEMLVFQPLWIVEGEESFEGQTGLFINCGLDGAASPRQQ
jgi:hypothetical protein